MLVVVGIERATKLLGHLSLDTKAYTATVRLGQATDTDDAEGRSMATSDNRPTQREIEAILPDFHGEILQTPPQFSAIKIEGERAYDLARAGQAVDLKPRLVTIEHLELLGRPDADHADFVVGCGKGTYIRSLGRDLAKAVGTVGHLSALRRTVVGPFREAAAISLPKLEALGHNSRLLGALAPVATALDDIPALALTEAQASRLRQGQPLTSTQDAPTSGALYRAEQDQRQRNRALHQHRVAR